MSTPVYAKSEDTNELWLPLVEKAFAKALGSYEEISNMKIQKALLHLTGGSVQAVALQEEVHRQDVQHQDETFAFGKFRERFNDEVLILLQPVEKDHTKTASGLDSSANFATSNTGDGSMESEGPQDRMHHDDNYFVPDAIYSVILCREIGGHEMVLLHNPWRDPNYRWTGVWSDVSNEWDLYPELLVEVESDPNIPWKHSQPNGYFWMSFRSLVKNFNRMYVCKLFPSERYHFYCANGRAEGETAGGPLNSIRDKVCNMYIVILVWYIDPV